MPPLPPAKGDSEAQSTQGQHRNGSRSAQFRAPPGVPSSEPTPGQPSGEPTPGQPSAEPIRVYPAPAPESFKDGPLVSSLVE